MGPLLVITRVIRSYNSVFFWDYNPSYPFIGPFIGALTPFITRRGPPSLIVALGGVLADYSPTDSESSTDWVGKELQIH